MHDNRYRFLPRYDHVERTWAVLAPSASDPTMDQSEAPQRHAGGQRSTQGGASCGAEV
jgi:hypothetical protein